jgi:hypothetical protein
MSHNPFAAMQVPTMSDSEIASFFRQFQPQNRLGLEGPNTREPAPDRTLVEEGRDEAAKILTDTEYNTVKIVAHTFGLNRTQFFKLLEKATQSKQQNKPVTQKALFDMVEAGGTGKTLTKKGSK